MSKPEWKDAPEDAMFLAPETDDYHASWYKLEDECWFCVSTDAYRVFNSPWYALGRRMLRDDLEPRP